MPSHGKKSQGVSIQIGTGQLIDHSPNRDVTGQHDYLKGRRRDTSIVTIVEHYPSSHPRSLVASGRYRDH